MKKFELTPINGRKSFYGKCYCIEENGETTLYSYDTPVAVYLHRSHEVKIYGTYSKTTVIHINAFLDYFGFDAMTKKELSALVESRTLK